MKVISTDSYSMDVTSYIGGVSDSPELVGITDSSGIEVTSYYYSESFVTVLDRVISTNYYVYMDTIPINLDLDSLLSLNDSSH